jgi:hypothetical protein
MTRFSRGVNVDATGAHKMSRKNRRIAKIEDRGIASYADPDTSGGGKSAKYSTLALPLRGARCERDFQQSLRKASGLELSKTPLHE